MSELTEQFESLHKEYKKELRDIQKKLADLDQELATNKECVASESHESKCEEKVRKLYENMKAYFLALSQTYAEREDTKVFLNPSYQASIQERDANLPLMDNVRLLNKCFERLNKELIKDYFSVGATKKMEQMADIVYTLEDWLSRFPEEFEKSYQIKAYYQSKKEEAAKLNQEVKDWTDKLNHLEKWDMYPHVVEFQKRIEVLNEEKHSCLLSSDRTCENMPDHVVLGFRKEKTSSDTASFLKTIGLEESCLSNTPYNFDLDANHSTLVINVRQDQIDTNDFSDSLAEIFMQFISSFPPKYLQIMGMRNKTGSLIEQLVGAVQACFGNKIALSGVKNNSDQIKDGITEIADLITERVKGYGRLYKNIYELNEKVPDTKQSFVLLLVNDYPNGFNDVKTRQKLEEIMQTGGASGIITVLINNIDKKIEDYGETILPLDTNELPYPVLNYSEKNIFKEKNGKEIVVSLMAPGYDEKHFWNDLKKKNTYVSKSIMLKSIIEDPSPKPDYFDELKIPVGKSGNDIQYFTLDVEGTGKASAIIAGGTGSGKTSFLHTIILSAAYRYSPSELEFYLIDFKDGVEFTPYRSKENGINIPHVTFLSLKNKVEDAYDLLQKISSLKAERNRLFNQAGVTDFKSYHRSPKVQSGELPKLKRTIVIIDEYQNLLEPAFSSNTLLSNRCAAMLLALFKEIRNVGISIILCSQSISVNRESMDQIYNRFVFSSTSNVIQRVFSNGNPDTMADELKRERGLCYQTKDGGSTAKMFKSAWAGTTNGPDQKELARMINEKYPDSKTDLIISGNENQLSILDGDGDFAHAKPIDKEEEKYSFDIPIGQSFLSNEVTTIRFSDSEPCSYLLLGDLAKTRNLEFSLGLGFLYELKKDPSYDLKMKLVSYCDTTFSSEHRRKPSPYHQYEPQLSEYISYLDTESGICEKIRELKELYIKRRDAHKTREEVDYTPRLLIVNTASSVAEFKAEAKEEDSSINLFGDVLPSLSSSSDNNVASDLALLYERGYEQQIFVVLQDKDPKRLRTSLDLRNVQFDKGIYCTAQDLRYADFDNAKESININELAPNCVVVLPNVSKTRPYQFHGCDEFISKMVEVYAK